MANTIDSKDIDCLANVDESLQQRELNSTYKRKKKPHSYKNFLQDEKYKRILLHVACHQPLRQAKVMIVRLRP